MNKFYILRSRQVNTKRGSPDEIDLVGPFTTSRSAAAYGRSKRHNPNDNPCWQVVKLYRDRGDDERGETYITLHSPANAPTH